MGTKGNGNNGYDAKIWDQIQAEWLAGQLSLSDISRTYGPSRSTIRAKAKRFNWPQRGSLAAEVRKEIQSQLLDDGGAPASAPSLPADQIIESAAKRGAAVVRRQRDLLARLLEVADRTLKELEEMQLITRDTLKKKRTKAQAQLVTALTKAKLDGMRAVSQILSQAIPLERLAYSLDDDKGGAVPIKYVAPVYEKSPYSGLSEDQWA
jgi:hypothetical protein